jgi:hypothetical protein
MRRAAVWMAWSLWAVAAAVAVGAVALAAMHRESPHTTLLFVIGQATLALVYPAVGALVAARKPRNPTGWILLAIGLGQGLSAFGYEYAVTAFTETPGALPGAVILRWVSNWVWAPTLGLMVTFLLLLFPDGRLPSRHWRPLAFLSAGALAVAVGVLMIGLWSERENLLSQPDSQPDSLLFSIFMVGVFSVAACGIGCIASLVVRFRRSTGTERQQLKWITYGGVLTAMAVGMAFTEIEGLIGLVLVSPLLAMPLAIGVAVLRYRLYDIDRIINRTLVYGGLTVLLAAVYVGVVVGLGTLIGQSTLLVAGSTLLVAALFRPARRRVQGLIDRRFYRQKYDAARTLEAFSARLRDEVDLDSLTGDLVGVVRETMQPARASLWLRTPEGPR